MYFNLPLVQSSKLLTRLSLPATEITKVSLWQKKMREIFYTPPSLYQNNTFWVHAVFIRCLMSRWHSNIFLKWLHFGHKILPVHHLLVWGGILITFESIIGKMNQRKRHSRTPDLPLGGSVSCLLPSAPPAVGKRERRKKETLGHVNCVSALLVLARKSVDQHKYFW